MLCGNTVGKGMIITIIEEWQQENWINLKDVNGQDLSQFSSLSFGGPGHVFKCLIMASGRERLFPHPPTVPSPSGFGFSQQTIRVQLKWESKWRLRVRRRSLERPLDELPVESPRAPRGMKSQMGHDKASDSSASATFCDNAFLVRLLDESADELANDDTEASDGCDVLGGRNEEEEELEEPNSSSSSQRSTCLFLLGRDVG